MFISFSGTDGAGKSTQIQLLSEFFQKSGRRYKIIWARGGYTPIFSLIKKLLQVVLNKKIPKSGPSDSRSRVFRKKYIAELWLKIAIADLFLFYGVYARLLALFGFVVVCDRYIEDTEIDFKRNFPNNFDSSSLLWRLVRLITPTAKHSFLLHVPVGITLMRSKQKNEPFPDSAETLQFRLDSYLNEDYFPNSKYIKIDCQGEPNKIHSLIIKHVTNSF